MCPTRWRYALAVPKLNHPPCKCRIALPDRLDAGCTQRPGTSPTEPFSKVTSPGGGTRSIKASNCARASMVADRTPFAARIAAFMAVIAGASSGSRGCIAMDGVVSMCRSDAICDPHSKRRIDCVLTNPDAEISPVAKTWTRTQAPPHATPLVAMSPRQTAGLTVLAHEHKAFVSAYE